MAPCEMCGNKQATQISVVEGSQMSVCEGCAKFGKTMKRIFAEPKAKAKDAERPKQAARAEAPVETVVSDFAERVRKSREKTGMTQEDFAKKVAEKPSIIHKLETGSFVPPIPLARKLEKILHITLVEEEDAEKDTGSAKTQGGALTIGDVIQLSRGK
jgi:putative transcription factor